MLFDNVTNHSISIASKNSKDKSATLGDLVNYVCEELMKDPRKELFVLDKSM